MMEVDADLIMGACDGCRQSATHVATSWSGDGARNVIGGLRSLLIRTL
jgi:hypothetical protein